tara:strand:- start:1236 stop:1529 length:294 start_codon:yes stop_codon:yes gene_type:complete
MADIVAQENNRPTDQVSMPDAPPTPGTAVLVLDGVIDLVVGMPEVDGEPACTLASSDPPGIGPPSPSYREVLAAGMAEMGLDPAQVDRQLADLDWTR